MTSEGRFEEFGVSVRAFCDFEITVRGESCTGVGTRYRSDVESLVAGGQEVFEDGAPNKPTCLQA